MMRRNDGFTLTGLIISVLLISILSAISIPLMSGPLRRQRLNNLVIELSGWLEEVSVRAEFAGAPCTVIITTGTLTPGATLAQVTPAACAIQNPFVVPSFLGGAAQNYAVAITDSASDDEGVDNSWSFTPRGSITDPANIEIRVNLNGRVPVRCIQLSSDFGYVRLGSNNAAANAATPCDDYTAI